MSGEMFGAPAGIGAAEADLRQNVVGALQAQKVLGEIAMQPEEQRLKAAHARAYEAEAGAKEQEMRQTQMVMQRMAALGQRQGEAADLPDPASKLDEIGNIMLESGAYVKGAKMLSDASRVRAQTATAETAVVRQQLMADRAKKIELEHVGSLAASAADQASWDYVRPQLEEKGLQGLPADFNAARGLLQTISRGSMTAAQQLAAKAKDVENGQRQAHWTAQEREWNSRITRANAAVRLTNAKYDDFVKNGGANSAAALDLKKARAEAIRARTAAQQGKADFDVAKNMPPTDPTKRQVGKAYTNGKGQWATWNGKDFTPLSGPPRGAIVGAAPEAADDEGDDEGDE